MITDADFKVIFLYIKSEGIKLNLQEFLFRAKNHPEYPSLLAITDCLSFFKIDNGIISVESPKIGLLPDRYVTLLKNENGQPQLYFIEKIDDVYYHLIGKKNTEISKSELESRWSNLVLLLEKSKAKEKGIGIENNYSKFFPSIYIFMFLYLLIQFDTSSQSKLFFIFPVMGILFSVASVKELLGIQHELLYRFCNITVSSSCATVVGSTKWKIFEIVNFSDLSMVFFTSQFITLVVFLLSGNATIYFNIQQILLLSAVPVLLLSAYYQKFVEKKWCPICLVIISIIILEIGYLFVFQNITFTFSVFSIVLYGLVFMSVLIVWSALKKLLTNLKVLKEFQLKGTRFMRNYDVFKNTLLASDKTNYRSLLFYNMLLGNENGSVKITLVTNPFCGHCKEAHAVVEEILQKHQENVFVDFRFNFNIEHDTKESIKVHQKLIRIYYDNGQGAFLKALHDWFENKDESQLIVPEKSTLTDLKINDILQEQYLMNQANEISFTPAIIINQYQYPKMYDRNELVYFINDLVEDEYFQ